MGLWQEESKDNMREEYNIKEDNTKEDNTKEEYKITNEYNIKGFREDRTKNLRISNTQNKIKIEYDTQATAVYGLGQRYCSVNHIGKKLKNEVFEKFCEQGEKTYFPLPFYHTNDGHGVFVKTAEIIEYNFSLGHFSMEMDKTADFEIYFFYGTMKEIIAEFIKMTGEIALPPKWTFGVWTSANRWTSQHNVEEQVEFFEKYQYPANVIVLEAWSDEATFYTWNGSTYPVTTGEKGLCESVAEYHEPWQNPIKMIEDLHIKNIKLVLWQIPALKLLEEGQNCPQHEVDCKYAADHELVGKNMDGSPYKIPRQWFIGAMIPDFANPETRKWWFKKRQHLLDMGVDGFKTDGGEFVHDLDTIFYDNQSGKKVRNLYPAQYEEAYTEFIGKDRVLFSRAGYTGAQKSPMHWAGDQFSKFEELRAQLNAGLSLALCGIPFWSFDIGGFAGPLPSKELYLRATSLAAFSPVMQWHSEPSYGQFADIVKGDGRINDRSPWNMADVWKDVSIIETATFYANLHMNLVPYIYQEALKSIKERSSLMKHLYLEYNEDEKAAFVNDEYMIGDLLIAPLLEEGRSSRDIYLPKGKWLDMWTGNEIEGPSVITVEAAIGEIPVFVRTNSVIFLNITDEGMGSYVGNDLEDTHNLTAIVVGSSANGDYINSDGNRFCMEDGIIKENTLGIKVITLKELVEMKRIR